MRAFRFLSWGLFLVLAGPVLAGAERVRLDRNDLLQYRDSQGKIRPVETAADWERRRAEIVQGMQEVMGEMPGEDRRVPLEPRVLEEVDRGTYVRRLITYQSEPESRTPAYLCIPKDVLAGQRRAPAVLCLHGTNREVGHQIVVRPELRRGRAYGAELAERGYVTLSPAYPHLANYWPNLGGLGYVSGTMKAIWDNSRGLDLLASLPYVDDSKGFASIGHSLGGHNSIYTAVLDQRIRAVVSSCGFRFLSGLLRRRRGPLVFRKGLVPDPVHAAALRLPGTPGGDPIRFP